MSPLTQGVKKHCGSQYKLSFRSGSHVSQLHLATQQTQHHHSHPHQQPHTNPLQSPAQKSMSEDEGDASNAPEDGETDEDPKSPHSVQSDLSDAFDWWFNKPKRNSKKSSAQQQHETAQLQHQQTTQQHATPLTPQNHNQYQKPQNQYQNQHLSKAMTFWHQASTTPRSSYRSFFNSLADQIYSKRSTPSQLNINNGFILTPTHRSSPVSSCCGSSSQGRSSPDTDPAEPPEFPLSPG
ncbi:GD15223 [Drosophila simulans]|uniref:GD15223 n=1 Tax=Drosophila simulans TaxID=7240 RepID=B4NSK6_DROSI|nr:GD15223 [Drosophila simulans]